MEHTVHVMTREEIEERRAELLASIGLDMETIRLRQDNWALSPEQRFAIEEYDGLGWLIGE
ncbi:hypothetical protein KQI48_05995 [Cellulomonas hominis]|uniref:Uncharacterized protein n=1 Tax=Cellulomonas hominis TaxID=156981 RepID=A0A511FB94_9CELL|nr:hypothetical protein [Cellulomonas hominis]MBB5472758.1 hypothetical protein [Cellulomonas hominis]MBU5422210.1 hypothetical protein [Cellulomonas hominis]NKY06964.1 hypothetical protein [Cellulomonas hominis]NKY10104.1 hypothetical protein [Cellulomonas hominis]GEL46531.1 hypothetical protein CHO01_16470 [Cellulomonas hominis]